MRHSAIIKSLPAILMLITACSQEENWELTWSDEFNKPGGPDEQSWSYETGYKRNNELQYYTNDTSNVFIKDGILTIRAIRENDTITSGSIHTSGKVDFLYGRVEVRAQIPTGLGTWPAIWMLGNNIKEVHWPACGEIDIMENVGYDPGKIHANIHTKSYNHVMGTNKGNTIDAGAPWEDFHVYSLEWFEDHLDIFFDDSLYFTFRNDMEGNPDTWPFDKPHYLILNFAFGGDWGGAQGVDTTLLPLDYRIDYVRYYRNKK